MSGGRELGQSSFGRREMTAEDLGLHEHVCAADLSYFRFVRSREPRYFWLGAEAEAA